MSLQELISNPQTFATKYFPKFQKYARIRLDYSLISLKSLEILATYVAKNCVA